MAKVDARRSRMTVDLGGEQVILERFKAIERINRPFEFIVDIASELGELDLRKHLGKPITLSVDQVDGDARYFHGHIIEAEFIREARVGWRYRLWVRPWSYFLDQNRHHRIHQDMTVIDVLKKRFQEARISHVDYSRLAKQRKKRTYTVQYGESDFAFVSRLMEEEGIYYFFEHKKDRHTMVLCDGPGAHKTGFPSTMIFNPDLKRVFDAVGPDGKEPAFLIKLNERLTTANQAKITVRDWDFRRPQKPLEATHSEQRVHERDEEEVYIQPGTFVRGAEGDSEAVAGEYVRNMLAARRAERAVYHGQTDEYGLEVGFKFKVTDHPVARFNDEYMVTAATHTIMTETHRSDTDLLRDDVFDNEYDVEFEAIPASVTFHAPQRHPRPLVQGMESGIIVGPPGEVIYTDEYGRVKVQFHWDREGKSNAESSCWMRVSQTGGLGNIIMPRIGHEVLIDFLNGDPDRPLVVGRVFNAEHMPIYKLPDNRTIATWRTKTVGKDTPIPEAVELDTGNPLASELRFEDAAGKEEVFLHAQRFMNVRVRGDGTHHVGRDHEEKIYRDRTRYVKRNEKIDIDGTQTSTIKQDVTEKITMGSRSVTIEMGNDTEVVKMGNYSLKCSLGKIEMEAMQSITLTVGGSKITVDQMGVRVEGMMVSVKGNVSATMESLMTTVQGSAMTTVKGGIVMIN